MRSLELTVDSETARSLAVEAELVGFDGIDAYLKWLIAHRFEMEATDERGRKLAAYADELRDSETGEQATTAQRESAEARTPGDDRNGVTARIRDDQLTAAADALSDVDGQRLDRLTEQALEKTRRDGTGSNAGGEYRSQRPLVDEKRPGEDITNLDTLEVPGWDEASITRRQEAVGAALAFLRREEEATRREFVDELYEEYPAGYDSPDSWWECIARGLRQVDRVDPARQDNRVWRFRTTPGRVTRISF